MWNSRLTLAYQLAFFYNDYVEASSLATSFDDQLQADSIAAGGSDYYAITALASRQAFGALEFANTPTVPYLFLKEISSDGNIQTVDVIVRFSDSRLACSENVVLTAINSFRSIQ